MSDKEIKKNLCYYDPENPNNNLEAFEDEDSPQPRKECYCDNCFYRRDKLAMQLLEVKRERDEAREEARRLDGAYEDATNYYARIIELIDERDEAREENKRLREEVEDLKARYRSAMMDRDSYRFHAEQKFAMRRELEELLGIDNGAPGDEQFKKGLKALKAVVRKAKLYDKKN